MLLYLNTSICKWSSKHIREREKSITVSSYDYVFWVIFSKAYTGGRPLLVGGPGPGPFRPLLIRPCIHRRLDSLYWSCHPVYHDNEEKWTQNAALRCADFQVMGSRKGCPDFHLNGAVLEEIVYPVKHSALDAYLEELVNDSFSPDLVKGLFLGQGTLPKSFPSGWKKLQHLELIWRSGHRILYLY